MTHMQKSSRGCISVCKCMRLWTKWQWIDSGWCPPSCLGLGDNSGWSFKAPKRTLRTVLVFAQKHKLPGLVCTLTIPIKFYSKNTQVLFKMLINKKEVVLLYAVVLWLESKKKHMNVDLQAADIPYYSILFTQQDSPLLCKILLKQFWNKLTVHIACIKHHLWSPIVGLLWQDGFQISEGPEIHQIVQQPDRWVHGLIAYCHPPHGNQSSSRI